MLHLDLKPSNILLDPKTDEKELRFPFTVRLGDFGLGARLKSQGEPVKSAGIAGTLRYMPPEQLKRERQAIGTSSDIYGLGAVLYELLTGVPPFANYSDEEFIDQIATAQPRPVRELRAGVPRDLEAICLKCLAKDPRERYQSARELAAEFQRFLVGLEVSARPLGPVGRLGRNCRRHPLIVSLLTLPADLDAIVGKCLRHSPQDRYQSAASLAGDLRSFLRGEPVAARPMRAAARTIRWCRNRPILTALSAVLFVAAFVGTGGIAWQWRRAENHLSTAEAERSRAERRSVQLERALLDLSTATEAAEFWQDHTRVVRYPQFASEASPFQSLLFDSDERGDSLPLLALSHDQIALHHELRNEFALAKECYRKSIAQWYAIVCDSPDDPLYRRRFLQACYAYGRFLCIREKLPNGQVHIHDDRLLEIVPLSDGPGFELAGDYLQFLFDHGSNLAKAKGWEGAASTFAAAHDLGRALSVQRPKDARLAALLAKSAMMQGKATRSAGDRRAGAALLQQAYDETVRLAELHPDDLTIARTLAETAEALTSKDFKRTRRQRQDLLELAILALDRALERSSEQADCDDLRVAADLYRERAATQRTLELVGTEAKASLLRACEYYDRLLAMRNSTGADASAAAMGYYDAAKACDQLSQEDEAFKFATRAVDAFSKQVPGKELRLARIEAHVDCLALQANHLHVVGKSAEAAETLRKGIAVIENSEVRFPNNAHLVGTKRKLTTQLEQILRGDGPAKL